MHTNNENFQRWKAPDRRGWNDLWKNYQEVIAGMKLRGYEVVVELKGYQNVYEVYIWCII